MVRRTSGFSIVRKMHLLPQPRADQGKSGHNGNPAALSDDLDNRGDATNLLDRFLKDAGLNADAVDSIP